MGERALHFVETRYISDGRLVQTGPRRQMMPYTPGWFVLGATLQERVKLRSVLVRDLLSYQDPRTGGFFGSAESRDAGAGIIDFDSTTQACAALCVAGQERAALKCGEYLRALAKAQPDPERQMLLQWDSGKGLVKDFDPAKAFGHVLVYGERKQHLYKIGLLARAFRLRPRPDRRQGRPGAGRIPLPPGRVSLSRYLEQHAGAQDGLGRLDALRAHRRSLLRDVRLQHGRPSGR